MTEIELRDLVKIYPYIEVKGLFHRKQRAQLLAQQRTMPYTTNEGVIVLQKISARIRAGEFVVLLGHSGCGKTTLLRIIAGLEQPTLGEVLFDGKPVTSLPPEERDVAMVFQNYALYPHLTVFDNIAFPLRRMHMPREQLRRTVQEMAELLEMGPWLDRLPSELSGGQLQRVAIARALVRQPRVFLMDEPFSNLDAPLRAELRRLVQRIHKKLGTTFLYVTHDHQEALALGERILVMHDGIVVQDGTPSDIYVRPASSYVAANVGSPAMNLLPADCGLFGQIPRGAAQAGIRPVNICRDPAGQAARVLYTEPLGTETIVHLKLGDWELAALWPSADAADLFRGSAVPVSFPRERLHFFDAEGSRL